MGRLFLDVGSRYPAELPHRNLIDLISSSPLDRVSAVGDRFDAVVF
ncbi:MAG: hypothetical protein AAFX76_03035 [Planctomycetota bacterium]